MSKNTFSAELMDRLTATDFVDDFTEDGGIRYSKDFYMAMHKEISKGLSYVQAYEALGFPVKELGTDRANACGKRAEQLAREGKLNYVDPSSYDGRVPLKEMQEYLGKMSLEEQNAYLTARTIWLETAQEVKKKFLSDYAEKISSLRRTTK